MLEKLQKKEEGKIFCSVSAKGVISNSNLFQFCRCWIHKRFSGIRGDLKDDCEFGCQTCASEETHNREMYRHINGMVSLLKFWKSFVILVTKYELKQVQSPLL